MFNWLKRRRPRQQATDQWDFRKPLLRWNEHDAFTVGDSFEGMFVVGRTGSGKTSATGRQLALSMLGAGYGGLVATVKPGEADQWRDYCRLSGREDDLRVVDASCTHRFDFMQAMQQSQGADAGLTENFVALLMEVGQVGSRQSNASVASSGDNAFFQQACRVLMRNAIDLALLAGEPLSVGLLCRIVSSMPKSLEQVRSEEWQRSSLCYRLLRAADTSSKSPRQLRDYEAVLDYGLSEWPSLADRTRSSISATFFAFADLFQRGQLHDLLSQGTTLSPAEINNGKVIVIDLPLKVYGEVGLIAQLVWKLMTQRLLERRTVTKDTRPAFLFIDEAQFFASGQNDALFATTCRSARVALVMLTQSVAGFYTAFGGGETGRSLTDQLLANLSTKVVHALGDHGSSEWAAELCGREYRYLTNASESGESGGGRDWAGMAGLGRNGQSTAGLSESLQYDIEPREFAYLRTGGVRNDRLVDAVVIRSGNPFTSTGKLWMPVTLSQD